MKNFFNIKRQYYNTTVIQFLFMQIFLIIVTTYLLILPISFNDHKQNLYKIFMNAYITAVSTSTLSGIMYRDIYSSYTLFGQFIILFITQLNSIGLITFFIYIKNIFKQNICLSDMFLMKESMSLYCFKKIIYMVKFIIKISLFFELFGTLYLSVYYIPKFNYFKGIYFALFHSVSVFSNSGVDVMGGLKPYSSLHTILNTNYYSKVIITFIILTIAGGIGFTTWHDIYIYKFNFKKYSLNSKISIISTIILILCPTFFIYKFESNNSFFLNKNIIKKILYILFYVVSSRTSGFNLIVINKYFTFHSRLLILILMFIGGCPGSTAGGVKTTTIVISILGIFSEYTNQKNIKIFNRRINKNIIRQSNCIIILHVLLIIFGGYIVNFLDPRLTLEQSFFEVTSALSTVGLTMKRNTIFLHDSAELVLSIYMIFGKIGSIIIFTSFSNIIIDCKYKKYREEQIFIG